MDVKLFFIDKVVFILNRSANLEDCLKLLHVPCLITKFFIRIPLTVGSAELIPSYQVLSDNNCLHLEDASWLALVRKPSAFYICSHAIENRDKGKHRSTPVETC